MQLNSNQCHLHEFRVDFPGASHCRNERQIDFLGIDENYNFDLQQAVSLGSIKTIKQVRVHYFHAHL